MLPLPHDFSLSPSTRGRWLASPMVIFLALLTLIHLATFIPAYYAQKNYLAKSAEFRVTWNSGGSMSLAKQGIDPNTKEEATRRHAYLATFVEGNPFYHIWIVPAWDSIPNILLAWALQPGWLSLLLSIWVLLYAGVWLENRWDPKYPVLLTLGYSLLSGLLYLGLMCSLIDRYPELPFCGISAGAAAAVGFLLRRHVQPIPVWTWWKGAHKFTLPLWAFAAIWFALDFLVQVIANPLNYGWVLVIDLIAAGSAYALAQKVQLPERRQAVRAPNIDASTQARAKLQEGWRQVEVLELESALGEIDQAIRILLRASQPDKALLEETFQRMFTCRSPLPVSSQQWYEWGTHLVDKGMPNIAVNCLENAVKTPGADQETARSAVVQATELRLAHKLSPEQSSPWLERVIKLRPDDLLGRKATKLLEQIPIV